MVQCKDCIHNDLCKEMHKFGLVDLPYNDNAICDLFKSSADVVPKSEVELLRNDIKFLQDRRFKELSEVRREAVEKFAEEIKLEFYREFDEIIPSIMADKIDELKKKYTES